MFNPRNSDTPPGQDSTAVAPLQEIPPTHKFVVTRVQPGFALVKEGESAPIEVIELEAHEMNMLAPAVVQFCRYYHDVVLGPSKHIVRQFCGYIDIIEIVESSSPFAI